MDCKDVTFRSDALTSYSGEKFEITWGDSLNSLYHIYTKKYDNNKMKVRNENSGIAKQAIGRCIHG
jgi:hypothetical protein